MIALRIALYIAGGVFFVWVSLPVSFVHAANSAQLYGWAWSENIGWISFNSKNCDANGDGVSDGSPSGCPSAGTPMAQYNVSRDANGNLSGYAWSENIGWIKFDPSGPYPGSPNKSSRIPNNGAASGWFRAIANDSSWDGWMKFDSGGNYGSGVTLDADGINVLGYGWGSDIVGWIHFDGPNGLYGVRLQSGAVTNLSADTTSSGVVCSNTPQPSLSWTYTDYGGLSQSAYQLQISTNSGFGNPVVDTGKVISSSNSYIVGAGVLNYGTTYYWRIRAWNTDDVPTPYAQSSFATTAHRGPTPSFTWSPNKPPKNSVATLTDTSATSGGSSIQSRSWTFPSSATNTTPPPTDAVEKVKFQDAQNPVTEKITDSDNLACSVTNTITAISPVLQFKEVAPQ